MENQYYQGLLLIAFSFLICVQGNVFDHFFSRDASANLQPVSSPGQQPVDPPTPEPAPPLNYVSFPPSGSDPPSGSISPATGSFSSRMGPVSVSDPPLNDFPPDPTSDSISPSSDIDPGVKKICESTDHPSLCLATVTPFLNGKSDVLSVLEVAMKASKELAKIAFSMVKRFATAPGTPPKLLSILKDCKDSYNDALYNFENALNAFSNRDIGTMNTMLSSVITAVGDCDDEISQLGSPSPVARYADKLTNMTSNCLAIVSLVH